MNTTVTVQVDNLPAVKHALAKAGAEIERLTAMVAVLSVNALRGPYKVGERWPSDERIVLALCRDSEYRIMFHGGENWFIQDSPFKPWRADGKEMPVLWWKLPEVTP